MPTKRKFVNRQLRPREIPAGIWRWLIDAPFDPAADNTGLLVTFQRDHGELWAAHRAAVLGWWIVARPGTRPPLWWEFEAPAPLRRGERELDYLRRHRLLAPGEAERAAEKSTPATQGKRK